MLYSLRGFEGSEIAQQRMKVAAFYKQYGEEATKEAFGADRKVISRWRKRLKGEVEEFLLWCLTHPSS